MNGLTAVIGTTVPGTKGKTLADQNAIDRHVARSCAAKVYSKEDCNRHTRASAERRRELREQRQQQTSDSEDLIG